MFEERRLVRNDSIVSSAQKHFAVLMRNAPTGDESVMLDYVAAECRMAGLPMTPGELGEEFAERDCRISGEDEGRLASLKSKYFDDDAPRQGKDLWEVCKALVTKEFEAELPSRLRIHSLATRLLLKILSWR